MASIVTMKNAVYKVFQGMSGKSLSVDFETIGKNKDDGEVYSVPGVYSKSVDGTKGVSINVNGNNIIIATHDYSLDKDVEKGELLLYCIDENGAVLSSALLNKSGEFVINDGTDYGVAYEDLKTAFDQLKDDFDNHLHTTTGTPGVSAIPGLISKPSTGVTPFVPVTSTADMSGAKVEKLRLP